MHRLIQDLRSFEKTDSAFAFGQYLHVTENQTKLKLPNSKTFS